MIKRTLIALALILPSALASRAMSARATAPDASVRGSFQVANAEYKLPAAIDTEVLPSYPVELWAKVFYPTDLSKPRPILFFMHGNHPTCGDGAKPAHHDDDCGYTTTGVCEGGLVVVPNHEGYNYLAEHLASHGYIVVSINANRGITCGEGILGDEGLNLARGKLILRHIEQWKNWSINGGLPATFSAQDLFVGAVDLGQVGLLGHSRGGEGVRAAYALYEDKGSVWPGRIPNLEIRGIFEIGGVDMQQTSRTFDADSVAWNQLLPTCDGDVADLEGRGPFERMILKASETRKTPKSLTMAWGTNHNFYNTEWQQSDADGCVGDEKPIYGQGPTSTDQQKIAIISATSFFKANIGVDRDADYNQQLDPVALQTVASTAITRIDRDYYRTNDDVFNLRVDDFDQAVGQSSAHVPNLANGIDVTNDASDTPKHADIKWRSAGADQFLQTNWTQPGQGADISGMATLDFRVSRYASPLNGASSILNPTDLSIALVLKDDSLTRSVQVSQYRDLIGPANDVALYQTIRIPITDFGVKPSDMIHGVRFIFDRTTQGNVYLANVRFTSANEKVMRDSRDTPLLNPDPTPANAVTAAGTGIVTDLMKLKISNFRQSQTISNATVLGITAKARSPYLNGKAGFEMKIRGTSPFPVQGLLPTLVIANRKFTLSRYVSPHSFDQLIFSLTQEQVRMLPARANMQVQYGSSLRPRLIWTMPAFNKADLIQ